MILVTYNVWDWGAVWDWGGRLSCSISVHIHRRILGAIGYLPRPELNLQACVSKQVRTRGLLT
jgi:hypothetical protein